MTSASYLNTELPQLRAPFRTESRLPPNQLWSLFSISLKVPMTLARAMLILRLISVAELDNEKDGAGTLSKWDFLES